MVPTFASGVVSIVRRMPLGGVVWQRVDGTLTDRAIWLPTVTPKTTDVLSHRGGNFDDHGMLGALIDQLWVR